MNKEYWKITELKKLIEMKKREIYPHNEKVTRSYLIDLKTKVKLMQEARDDFKEKVTELIDGDILTDIEGKPLPQCEILWKLKDKIKNLK